jgi:hypothetical protein
MGKSIFNGVESTVLQSRHDELINNDWVNTIQYSSEDDLSPEMVYVGFKDLDGTEFVAYVYETHVELYLLEILAANPDGTVPYQHFAYSDDKYDFDAFFNYLNSLPKLVGSIKKTK